MPVGRRIRSVAILSILLLEYPPIPLILVRSQFLAHPLILSILVQNQPILSIPPFSEQYQITDS